MKASHACSARIPAPRIQRTTTLLSYNRIEQVMQFSFEYGLQPPQHEIATRRSIDKESKMEGHKQLGKRVTVDTRKGRGYAKEPVRVRVHELQQVGADILRASRPRIRQSRGLQNRYTSAAGIGPLRQYMAALREPSCNPYRIEADEECLGLRDVRIDTVSASASEGH
ncbi:hypothetical protein WS80_29130 [Burkholderia pseudomultivorans]|nr:hypothetical protein WS80_29130 [Burkholderia pseudomultivorans]